jgi:hypothetical protein
MNQGWLTSALWWVSLLVAQVRGAEPPIRLERTAWAVGLASLPGNHVLAVGRCNGRFEWTPNAWHRGEEEENPVAFLRMYSPGFELLLSTAIRSVVAFDGAVLGKAWLRYDFDGTAGLEGDAPAMTAIPDGVKVGDDEVTFSGDKPTVGDAATYAIVKRGVRTRITLEGKDMDLDRSQGEVGLFVPDAGYPFGEIPNWLIRRRAKRPDWTK